MSLLWHGCVWHHDVQFLRSHDPFYLNWFLALPFHTTILHLRQCKTIAICHLCPFMYLRQSSQTGKQLIVITNLQYSPVFNRTLWMKCCKYCKNVFVRYGFSLYITFQIPVHLLLQKHFLPNAVEFILSMSVYIIWTILCLKINAAEWSALICQRFFWEILT